MFYLQITIYFLCLLKTKKKKAAMHEECKDGNHSTDTQSNQRNFQIVYSFVFITSIRFLTYNN
eukprot:gene4973-3571_t